MDSFPFELVSPEKLLISEDVQHVVVPGAEGEFGVLAHHAPFMSTLKPGIVSVYKTDGGEPKRLFVRGGFADVNPKGLTILADEAIALEELDTARIDAVIKAASDEVEAAPNDVARQKAQERMDRLTEIKAATL